MFRKILVAFDGSSRAARVFEVAMDIAAHYGGTLIPFHALAIPPEFPPAAYVRTPDPLPGFLHREAETRFQALRAAHAAKPGVVVRPLIVSEQDPAAHAILATAEQEDVDLIVLGSHGYHGWDRVLGTTAGKVANLATRSVLVVHTRELGTGG
jgi:nucleotide-binding universal stress UspA family protein